MITEYMDLGTAVNQALIKSEFPRSFLEERLASPMGLSPATTPEHIRHYSNGKPYGTSTSNPQNPNIRLERLAIFLYALGFSEKNEVQSQVIAGLRNIARENGHQFEYPPASEKKVSYDKLREEYKSMSSRQATIEEPQEAVKGKLELGEKVNLLLSMGIAAGPDPDIKLKEVIKREVVLVSSDLSYNVDSFNIHVIITVEPQKNGGVLLHSPTYRVTYSGHIYNNGGNRARQLNEFIGSHLGQKTHICYIIRSRSPIRAPLQMLAPIGSDTVYARRDGHDQVLEPYRIKPQILSPS